MRLRTKFLFLFLASSLFLLVEGLAAAWSLRIVGQDVDNLQIYAQTDDMCGQIKTELAQMPTVEDLERVGRQLKARRELVKHADRSLILCRSLHKLTASEPSLEAIAQIVSTVRTYRGAGQAYALTQISGEAGNPEREAALRAYSKLRRIQEEGVIEPVGHEARLATKRVVDRADSLNTWVTLGGLTLSVIFTVIAAIVLARATAQPIVRMVRAAREVGRGNLNIEVPVRTNDELGELGRAFNEMTGRLKESREGLEAEVRKRTEELRRREKDLERERRLAAIGRLAAGVAHEVSNPLTVIASAAEGLKDRANDEALKAIPAFEDFPDYLETIESEAYRLKLVVRRLLDFARTRPAEPFDLIDLRDVLDDAVNLVRLDPRAKEHSVHFARPKRSLPVLGNAAALKEALLNLLFNALDAVQSGGEVAAAAGRDGDEVFVEVADTGDGIEGPDLERLFEPFFTTKEEGEGTGLGLALVYGAVERHGGEITAHSDGAGRGARFRITLPLHTGTRAEETAPEESPAS